MNGLLQLLLIALALDRLLCLGGDPTASRDSEDQEAVDCEVIEVWHLTPVRQSVDHGLQVAVVLQVDPELACGLHSYPARNQEGLPVDVVAGALVDIVSGVGPCSRRTPHVSGGIAAHGSAAEVVAVAEDESRHEGVDARVCSPVHPVAVVRLQAEHLGAIHQRMGDGLGEGVLVGEIRRHDDRLDVQEAPVDGVGALSATLEDLQEGVLHLGFALVDLVDNDHHRLGSAVLDGHIFGGGVPHHLNAVLFLDDGEPDEIRCLLSREVPVDGLLALQDGALEGDLGLADSRLTENGQVSTRLDCEVDELLVLGGIHGRNSG